MAFVPNWLLSCRQPPKKWTALVKAALRDPHWGSKMGDAYNWESFKKWVKKLQDEAQDTDEGTSSANLFATSVAETGLVSDKTSSLIQECLVCGLGAGHASASCSKLAWSPTSLSLGMSSLFTICTHLFCPFVSDTFFNLCQEKDTCRKCCQATWTVAHGKTCGARYSKCQKGHVTCRHRYAVAAVSKQQADKGPRRPPAKKARAEPSREKRDHSRATHALDEASFQAAVDKGVEARAAAARQALMAPPPAPKKGA